MTKILTFKVEIKGLEDKIWRKIEIPDRRTIADLAYTILAAFDSLAYHLYNIKYKNKIYDCWICVEDNPDYEKLINAVKTKIRSLELQKNDTMEMEYDYGSTTRFIITYLDSREMTEYEGYLYPNIIDGAGRGMQDDISDFELKKEVEDTDKKGYSEYYVTPGYEEYEIYDYRKFNIKETNKKLKGLVLEIKNGYEVSDYKD